ncbi:hypothetical protein LX36DRAFT_715833 [Colletotrichum falcatum]|nr:hypothetical protein LX36DRAFT_715833 [Colletotrichum falcatum]
MAQAPSGITPGTGLTAPSLVAILALRWPSSDLAHTDAVAVSITRRPSPVRLLKPPALTPHEDVVKLIEIAPGSESNKGQFRLHVTQPPPA